MTLKTLLFIILVPILIFEGYFLWRQKNYLETEKLSGIDCPQTFDHYEVPAEYLVSKINNEPKSATVLKDFRQISGQVTANKNNLYLYILLNDQGKITTFICKNKKIYINLEPPQDFSVSIPETDFKNLVQNIDNLEESQAASYLANVTTQPASIRKTIIERILGSSQY